MTEEIKKPRKKAVNGKAKGSGFELTIAKQLTETLKPLIFKRTPGSGAFTGGQNARFVSDYGTGARTAFVGDIFPANEDDVKAAEGWVAKRTVECKFYKEADSFSAMFKNPTLAQWFEQATDDSKKLDKRALLLFKYNHTPIFYAVDSTDEKPNKISSSMALSYNVTWNGEQRSRTIFIGLLTDALEDTDWWKSKA